MPERQFSTRSAVCFLKLVLHPLGLWGDCWRRQKELERKDWKRGTREAWLKTMSEPCARHSMTWGAVIVGELRRTSLECLRHPDDALFVKLKNGTPWKQFSPKDRVTKGKLICRELGLDPTPFLEGEGATALDRENILRSRNWANSKAGKQLVHEVRKINKRKGKIVATREMTAAEVVDWVIEHLDAQQGSLEFPTAACRNIWTVAQQDPVAFVREYVRLAYKSNKTVTGNGEAPQEAAVLTLADLEKQFAEGA